MGVYTSEQMLQIIKKNPNKARIQAGRRMADKLMLHVRGKGMESAIVQCKYFENDDIYSVRKEYSISNKDLFGRLLQQEDLVFSAKGGSSYFNMPDANEKTMNALLSDVRYGMSLRRWMREFGVQAYRTDPMGVIFIEVEQARYIDAMPINAPRAYPTYKSIYSIFDYSTSGRRLEYVCFRVPAQDAATYGINDPKLAEYGLTQETNYFRFVDDAKDVIVKYENDQLVQVGDEIPNFWGRTNGFIVSDLMNFEDPGSFYSPLDFTTELADCFLRDRSVRDLQKRYHGFSKAVEPLLTCATCEGTGYVAANACKDCLPYAGAEKGTGYKMRTKVADVARFPLSMFEESSGFDFRKVFGYVTPDVEGWEKQDASLSDLEDLIHWTYWGTGAPQRAAGPATKPGNSQEETATKTQDNRQPRYARLNLTADWAEKTEMLIADFIGQFWFREAYKKASIAYGRYYILETPDELLVKYEELRTKGAPVATLFEALEKYYHSAYQSNPIELAIRLKLLYVEPFPHMKVAEAKGLVTDFTDFCCKLYFDEWYGTVPDMLILSKKVEDLRLDLRAFVKKKALKEPAPEVQNNVV